MKSLAAERRLLGWHSWETFTEQQDTWPGVSLLGQVDPIVGHQAGNRQHEQLSPDMLVKELPDKLKGLSNLVGTFSQFRFWNWPLVMGGCQLYDAVFLQHDQRPKSRLLAC